MIKTVISDLGKVLLQFDHMHSCRALSKHCRLPAETIYEMVFKSGMEKDYDLGRITSETFGRRVVDLLGLDIEAEAIQAMWSDIFRPMEGMEELIRSLKGRYRLVLLSNTNEWHFEHCLRNFPVVNLFDEFAVSFRLGCCKPDPAIFRKALDLAGSTPKESIFIDDVPAYVESAEALGIIGIVFENADKLKEDLRSAGVPVP